MDLINFSLLFILFATIKADKECVPRKYNHNSVVCVCNRMYCDEISKVKRLNSGNYVFYTSSQGGARFEKSTGKFIKDNNVKIHVLEHTVLYINRTLKFQKIMGFGGSFTDATGINILSLSPKVQNDLIRSYFGENGIEYNMARVPIGGTDFSTRFYIYNEFPEDDVNLSNFTLTPEDYKYKIDVIKKAKAVSKDDIHLMASSWDGPAWMKKINTGVLESQLDPKYYQTWADYHMRFLEEFDKCGIRFKSLTLGNEAGTAVLPIMIIDNFLGWNPVDQAKWLVNNLGPTLKKSKFSDINIIVVDDQRYFVPFWMEAMSRVPNATNFIDGIAVHWYADAYISITFVNYVHDRFPDKFIISNEASISAMVKFVLDTEKVQLGSWDKAELYIVDIMEDLNNWHVGWIDWNMALDMEGGPNWSKNYVDAAVIVNAQNDEFLKQPIYYAMGHFSKFIPRNSIKISVEESNDAILNVAFFRPDGGITVVLYNQTPETKTVLVQEYNKGHIQLVLKPKSLNTLIYW